MSAKSTEPNASAHQTSSAHSSGAGGDLGIPLEQHNLFSVPIWRSSLPEMAPHVETLREWILADWRAGKFQRHANGYGYQTQPILYEDAMLKAHPELAVLKAAFKARVDKILRQRTNHTTYLLPESYAFMAWILVQTNEDWVNGTWHDHYPATISGCFYLEMPETEREQEGALAFHRPGAPDTFVEQVQYIKPKQGDFVLFPSQIVHRPQPCPSAGGIRISINMDAFVHWRHWNEDGKPRVHPERYGMLVENSLDP
jgi:hypothetical protein